MSKKLVERNVREGMKEGRKEGRGWRGEGRVNAPLKGTTKTVG